MVSHIIEKTIYSFSNFFLSLPFVIFGLAGYDKNEVKADWQPPGYVFGIVWPILYLLFGIMNLRIFNLKSIGNQVRYSLINNSLHESLLQTLWLLVTSNLGNGRSFIQQFLGLIVMGILVYFCFKTRIPNLFKNDKVSFIMYLPYSLWISFAFILNLQIVLKYLKK